MRITIALERRPRIREEKPLKRAPRPVDKQRGKDDELLAWLDSLADPAPGDEPGSSLREIRQDAGWTQAEVADHIGCSPGLVTKWERGQIGWSRDFGLKYARLLQELEVIRDS